MNIYLSYHELSEQLQNRIHIKNISSFFLQGCVYLHGINFDELPLLILGSASFTSAPLRLWSPEILGAPLVGSFEELGILRKNSKPLFSWWSQKQVDENIQKINQIRASQSIFIETT